MSTPSGPTPRRADQGPDPARCRGLADREGLGALTMRRLGAELGVEAMSLYKHVANKDEILDGVVELIVGQIEIPGRGSRGRRRCAAGRCLSPRGPRPGTPGRSGSSRVAARWAPRRCAPLEAVLGNLRSAGFSLDDAAHAFWLLDSYVYGHVIQETSLGPVGPVDESTSGAAEAAGEAVTMADFPNLVALGERAGTARSGVAHGLDLSWGDRTQCRSGRGVERERGAPQFPPPRLPPRSAHGDR